MSKAAFDAVVEHSAMEGGAYLTMLFLADFVDSATGVASPSQDALAARSRQGERTVRRHLAAAEAAGEIEKIGRTEGGSYLYRILLEGAGEGEGSTGQSGRPANLAGPSSSSTVGIEEKGQMSLVAPSASKDYQQGVKVPNGSVGRFKITAEEWALATRLLARFNELSGKRLSPVSTRGAPTDNVKAIIGRVREYPDIGLDEHLRILDANFADPWWKGEPGGPGVIYGPGAFPRCAAKKGRTKKNDYEREDIHHDKW